MQLQSKALSQQLERVAIAPSLTLPPRDCLLARLFTAIESANRDLPVTMSLEVSGARAPIRSNRWKRFDRSMEKDAIQKELP